MINTLITQDRLDGIIRNASLAPAGLFAECGVYKGGSLKALAEAFPEQKIIGFDTFEGLPKEQWTESEHHKPGEFNDTSIEEVVKFVNSPNVKLAKGLFPQSAEPYKDEWYSFVHIDFDFYEGVKAAIEFFRPRMLSGGIMVFDDFMWPNCPGVVLAILDTGLMVTSSANYQAVAIL